MASWPSIARLVMEQSRVSPKMRELDRLAVPAPLCAYEASPYCRSALAISLARCRSSMKLARRRAMLQSLVPSHLPGWLHAVFGLRTVRRDNRPPLSSPRSSLPRTCPDKVAMQQLCLMSPSTLRRTPSWTCPCRRHRPHLYSAYPIPSLHTLCIFRQDLEWDCKHSRARVSAPHQQPPPPAGRLAYSVIGRVRSSRLTTLAASIQLRFGRPSGPLQSTEDFDRRGRRERRHRHFARQCPCAKLATRASPDDTAPNHPATYSKQQQYSYPRPPAMTPASEPIPNLHHRSHLMQHAA